MEVQETAEVIEGGNTNGSVLQISNKNSLIWITVSLESQKIPSMIDTGANPNCISFRCVQGSPNLRRLQRFPYSGKQIFDFIRVRHPR